MPLFNFYCNKCSKAQKKILDAEVPVHCPKCNELLVRVPSAPSSRTVEVLDNGVMPRRVERMHDIQKILQERSDKHK